MYSSGGTPFYRYHYTIYKEPYIYLHMLQLQKVQPSAGLALFTPLGGLLFIAGWILFSFGYPVILPIRLYVR